MKVKTVNLVHGVRLGKKGEILPIIEHLRPYTLELLEPVGAIGQIEVRPVTLGDVIATLNVAGTDHEPGTPGYRTAITNEHLSRRCTPTLTEAQMQQMAATDHDALMAVLDTGRDPVFTGKDAYVLAPDVEVSKKATIRLPMQNDRRLAEQRLPTTREDDPVLYEAYLVWFVTRFGEPNAKMFDAKPDFQAFLNLSWSDFQAISAVLLSRDFKPLTDILEGKVEVDGKPIPFQDVPGAGDEAAASKGKRGKATAA